MARKKVGSARESNLSQERVVESGDEDGHQKTVPKANTSSKLTKPNSLASRTKKPQQNLVTLGSNRTSDDKDSEESEEEEDDDDDEASTSDKSDQDSDGEESSRSDSSSNSVSSGVKRRSPITASTSARKKAKTSTPNTTKIAAQPFAPPKGYQRFGAGPSDYATTTGELFDDLSGKQVWHISAPASMPIEAIMNIDLQAAPKGEAILDKNGVRYSMHSLPTQSETILVPRGKDTVYKPIEMTMSRSFYLREMTSQPISKLPVGNDGNVREMDALEDDVGDGNDQANGAQRQKDGSSGKRVLGSMVFTATSPGKPKAIRQQPGGLKMRYRPYGDSSATGNAPHDEDMDVEMDIGSVTRTNPKGTSNERPMEKKKSQKNAAEEHESGGPMEVDGSASQAPSEPTAKEQQKKDKGKKDKKDKKDKKRRQLVDEAPY